MRRIIFGSLLLLIIPICSWGQVTEEDPLMDDTEYIDGMVESVPQVTFKKKRFIYLWDVTHSMQGKGFQDPKTGKYNAYRQEADIYDQVVAEMIRDINSITDETTEIVVIPFQSAAPGSYRGDKDPWIYETASGPNKQALISRIQASKKNWLTYQHENTDVVPALSYIIKSVISEDRVDYLKILTDGKMHDIEGLRKLMAQWCELAGRKKDMHAFHITLNDEAAESIRSIIKDATDKECIRIIPPGPDAICFYQVKPYPSIAVNANDQLASESPSVTAQMVIDGPGKLPETVKVRFESEENQFITVNAVRSPKENAFTLPLEFKMNLDQMKRVFSRDMKYPVKVHMTVVDGKDVYLLEDVFTLYLTVKKEKKMTLGWE